MAYWICEKCKLYYPARNENHIINLNCKCGGKLNYHDKISQYNSEEPNIDLKNVSPTLRKLISNYESVISRIILYCIEELPFPLSTKIIVLILQGSQTPFIKKNDLDQLETFSMLSNFSQNNLLTIIESLIENDFLKLDHVSRYSNKPVSSLTDEGMGYLSMVKFTDKGKRFMRDEKTISIGFMEDLEILKK